MQICVEITKVKPRLTETWINRIRSVCMSTISNWYAVTQSDLDFISFFIQSVLKHMRSHSINISQRSRDSITMLTWKHFQNIKTLDRFCYFNFLCAFFILWSWLSFNSECLDHIEYVDITESLYLRAILSFSVLLNWSFDKCF